jgi:hypothetical protein
MTRSEHDNPNASFNNAIDALHESGYSISIVDPSVLPQAAKIHALLNLLDSPAHVIADDSLVDATLLRCLASSHRPSASLTGQDAKALDALVEHKWEHSDIPNGYRSRSSRLARILNLLNPPENTVEPALVDRTWSRVRTHAATSAQRDLFEINTVRTGGLPLRDLAAIAAMIFVAFSILFPTLGAAKFNAQREDCSATLANAGVGFSLYSMDHMGKLPSTPDANRQGQIWWNVGQPEQSHSADLFMLTTLGYADLRDLACAGNPRAVIKLDLQEHSDWRSLEEVSYSYQLFPAAARTQKFAIPVRTVLLVDRSPLIARSQEGEYVSTKARSMNHDGHGQNILAADRSVQWIESPVTSWGDNIWLPAAYEQYDVVQLQGTESPMIWGDIFVGP